jgi:UDP-N-acetylmuramate: L-alanyl-gamma-D-glutamyl-meso-diaminopimelate ligase
MHIHILGVCGTFMAGVALLARAAGHTVSGCDAGVYPPMSTQLAEAGIALREGYDPEQLAEFQPDMVVVGNVMSRGRPIIEELLNSRRPYASGPAWLAEHVLRDRHALAVAGTHGKTSTSSLLAWILECAGLEPGFLIGGIPANFGVSARLGAAPFFVVEADEYDTAFFDKRSKFVHYQPRTLILNNLEFDHADIFPDLAAIQRQFHHLLRTVPGHGLIVANGEDVNLAEVLTMGCWTPVERFGIGDWEARDILPDGSGFSVDYWGEPQGRAAWAQLGLHNVHNALAALAAAHHVGVAPAQAIAALATFQGVKRQIGSCAGSVDGVTVYDDFAHHPTAIATTLAGLRARVGDTADHRRAGAALQHHETGRLQGQPGPGAGCCRCCGSVSSARSGLGFGRGSRRTRCAWTGLPFAGGNAVCDSNPAATRNPSADHEQWRLWRDSRAVVASAPSLCRVLSHRDA